MHLSSMQVKIVIIVLVTVGCMSTNEITGIVPYLVLHNHLFFLSCHVCFSCLRAIAELRHGVLSHCKHCIQLNVVKNIQHCYVVLLESKLFSLHSLFAASSVVAELRSWHRGRGVSGYGSGRFIGSC